MKRVTIEVAKQALERGENVWIYDQDMGMNILWGDSVGDSQWKRVVKIVDRGLDPEDDPLDEQARSRDVEMLGYHDRSWCIYCNGPYDLVSASNLADWYAERRFDRPKSRKGQSYKHFAKENEVILKRIFRYKAILKAVLMATKTHHISVSTEVGWTVMGGAIFVGTMSDDDEAPGPTVFKRTDFVEPPK